jgi:hypothetical protein
LYLHLLSLSSEVCLLIFSKNKILTFMTSVFVLFLDSVFIIIIFLFWHYLVLYFFSFFGGGTGFELRASHLLGRCSTT